ncbi:hypothetical protein DIPPA_00067 [Diplonema papillatum]|nr:hypothetical protein DIPPA_00067 [Diplonema papillatum]
MGARGWPGSREELLHEFFEEASQRDPAATIHRLKCAALPAGFRFEPAPLQSPPPRVPRDHWSADLRPPARHGNGPPRARTFHVHSPGGRKKFPAPLSPGVKSAASTGFGSPPRCARARACSMPTLLAARARCPESRDGRERRAEGESATRNDPADDALFGEALHSTRSAPNAVRHASRGLDLPPAILQTDGLHRRSLHCENTPPRSGSRSNSRPVNLMVKQPGDICRESSNSNSGVLCGLSLFAEVSAGDPSLEALNPKGNPLFANDEQPCSESGGVTSVATDHPWSPSAPFAGDSCLLEVNPADLCEGSASSKSSVLLANDTRFSALGALDLSLEIPAGSLSLNTAATTRSTSTGASGGTAEVTANGGFSVARDDSLRRRSRLCSHVGPTECHLAALQAPVGKVSRVLFDSEDSIEGQPPPMLSQRRAVGRCDGGQSRLAALQAPVATEGRGTRHDESREGQQAPSLPPAGTGRRVLGHGEPVEEPAQRAHFDHENSIATLAERAALHDRGYSSTECLLGMFKESQLAALHNQGNSSTECRQGAFKELQPAAALHDQGNSSTECLLGMFKESQLAAVHNQGNSSTECRQGAFKELQPAAALHDQENISTECLQGAFKESDALPVEGHQGSRAMPQAPLVAERLALLSHAVLTAARCPAHTIGDAEKALELIVRELASVVSTRRLQQAPDTPSSHAAQPSLNEGCEQGSLPAQGSSCLHEIGSTCAGKEESADRQVDGNVGKQESADRQVDGNVGKEESAGRQADGNMGIEESVGRQLGGNEGSAAPYKLVIDLDDAPHSPGKDAKTRSEPSTPAGFARMLSAESGVLITRVETGGLALGSSCSSLDQLSGANSPSPKPHCSSPQSRTPQRRPAQKPVFPASPATPEPCGIHPPPRSPTDRVSQRRHRLQAQLDRLAELSDRRHSADSNKTPADPPLDPGHARGGAVLGIVGSVAPELEQQHPVSVPQREPAAAPDDDADATHDFAPWANMPSEPGETVHLCEVDRRQFGQAAGCAGNQDGSTGVGRAVNASVAPFDAVCRKGESLDTDRRRIDRVHANERVDGDDVTGSQVDTRVSELFAEADRCKRVLQDEIHRASLRDTPQPDHTGSAPAVQPRRARLSLVLHGINRTTRLASADRRDSALTSRAGASVSPGTPVSQGNPASCNSSFLSDSNELRLP